MKQIKLSNGMMVLVDDIDYDLLHKFTWHAMKSGKNYYAQRHWFNEKTGIKSNKRMHREIFGIDNPNIQVDHIDRNGLNNQRSNLRLCNSSENHRNCKLRPNNTSGYRGVSEYKGPIIWKNYNGPIFRARINHLNKEIHVGYFKTIREAAIARDMKAMQLHGEFVVLNFPENINSF